MTSHLIGWSMSHDCLQRHGRCFEVRETVVLNSTGVLLVRKLRKVQVSGSLQSLPSVSSLMSVFSASLWSHTMAHLLLGPGSERLGAAAPLNLSSAPFACLLHSKSAA
jgi:hypothetical protein